MIATMFAKGHISSKHSSKLENKVRNKNFNFRKMLSSARPQ